MRKYDNTSELDTDAVETFLNDLDESDIKDLVGIVANLDRLEIVDGKPRWTSDEIAVIGKFTDFADDEENYESDDTDDEDEEDEDDENTELPASGHGSADDFAIHDHGGAEI